MAVGVLIPCLHCCGERVEDRLGALEVVVERLDPQAGPHTGVELHPVNRFRQEIVGVRLERLDLVGDLVQRGDHDHRNEPGLLVALELPADREAVHTRHHHVQQYHVGWLLGDEVESFLTARGADDPMAQGSQEGLQDEEVPLLVVHDENGLPVIGVHHRRLRVFVRHVFRSRIFEISSRNAATLIGFVR